MTFDSSMTHAPNFDNLRRTLLREGPPGPVPSFEIAVEPGVIGAVLGERFPLDIHVYGPQTPPPTSEEDIAKGAHALDMYVRFGLKIGYDFVPTGMIFNLPRSFSETIDTAAPVEWSDRLRYWQDETTGPIQNWADFEKYPWPKPEEISYAALEYLNQVVPDGMKISANLLGIFDTASHLMGFQSFAYSLYDQPDLVEAIITKTGDLSAAAASHAATLDNVGIILLADDMGYNKGTLVKPDVLRKHVYPRHKRLAHIAHKAGKIFVLHSCGNLTAIMDELIDEVGMDGKHSFEDAIMPVEEVHQRWGNRISVLGGVDMDILTRGTEEQVRARVREILDACGTSGTGYCLGSGNTIPDFMPTGNYLAMIDEGRRWNREHFGASW